MKFGLKDETVQRISGIFATFPELTEAILYGSRAMGTFKNGSDIDLTLKGTGLDLTLVNRIRLKLDDLLLPYTFDISIFDQIDNPDLIDHIERVGLIFYKKV